MKTKDMVLCAIFAALICVFSVMTIPIGAVPISMGLFGILLAACVLPPKYAVISVGVYILLGAVGLPVFAGFKGGIGVLTGPTGGYISSYIPVALFVGFFTRRLHRSKPLCVLLWMLAALGGVAICYFLGTLQFGIVADKTFVQSLSVCVLPFIPFDIAKCAAAAVLSYTVRLSVPKLLAAQ